MFSSINILLLNWCKWLLDSKVTWAVNTVCLKWCGRFEFYRQGLFQVWVGISCVALYSRSVHVQIFCSDKYDIWMSVALFTAGIFSQLSPVVAHTNWFNCMVWTALFLQRVENVLCLWIIIKFSTVLCAWSTVSDSFGPSSGPQHCGSDLPPFLMQSRFGFQSIFDQKRW